TEPGVNSLIAGLQSKIALLEAEAAHRRELIDTKFTTLATTLNAALAANDKRFDSMNELRGALSDQTSNFISRTEAHSNINSLETKVWADVNAIKDKQEEYGKPNYYLGVSIISAILISLGGLWTVTGLKIDNAIAPVLVQQEAFRTSKTSQDQRLTALTARIREIADRQAGITSLVEEGQIDRKQINERLQRQEIDSVARREDEVKAIGRLEIEVARLATLLQKDRGKLGP